MGHQPRLEQRGASPYICIRAHVTSEAEFRGAADRGFPELFGWLEQNGVEPTGPPFIRYLELDERDEPREIELGVPVGSVPALDGQLQPGVLPAGRYVTLLHVGPYTSAEEPDLASARAELLRWAGEQAIKLESSRSERGTEFHACVEHYLTDPSREPDSSKWETELAYLTAEG
jgi:hypothetical protein